MEEKKTKIIGIVIGIIIAIIIIAIGTAIFFTIRGNKKDDKKEAQAETPEVISGSSKKVTAGNTTLNSIDVSSSSKSKKKMEEYVILGEIEIPKTGLKCNILEEVTKRSIEIAVAQMYTTGGLNQPGNTVIYGHNYRNSLFFSKNDELENGDKIYITDDENGKITYEIYDIFETTSTDTTFYNRAADMTGGKREITLSTCTDDASETDRRLIILAREI